MEKIYLNYLSPDLIRISFRYDPVLVDMMKTIEGRKWDKEKKYWTLTQTQEAVKIF